MEKDTILIVVHPDLHRIDLTPALERALQFCMEGMSCQLRKLRISLTKDMPVLLDKCKGSENDLMQARPCHLHTVLKGKRFGLLHETLLGMGYIDADVALEASNGFPPLGWMKVQVSLLRMCGLLLSTFQHLKQWQLPTPPGR